LAGFFVLIPMAIGLATVGMTMVRSIRVFHLSRDAGRMFARDIDFSQTANRALLLKLANGLTITDTGGKGVLILSLIQCTATNQAYCVRRFVVGNAALRASSFCTPTKIAADGTVDYTHDAASNASSFLTRLSMSTGDTAYVVETYFSSAEFDGADFLGNGTYVLSVF
jgi:hypothetical protein